METFTLIGLIFGGLGIFLYGITFLSNNLKTVADGDRFRRMISKATSNRMNSCLVGTGFTALIQSSGGTYALSIGLVKAGALSYPSAIAIVIGANIGTCITSFLISIPGVSKIMPFVAFACALILMIVHNRKAQQWTKIIFSLSLIFFGISLMESNIRQTVDGQKWFLELMEFLTNNPWLGLAFGTVVTLLLQSCSAVIGVVQGVFAAAALVSGSPITLFGMLPIVIGSNIGAVIPSILSAIGGNAMAKRVALVNSIMKVSAALIFMGIIYGLEPYLNNIDPNMLDPKLQLAIGHLSFNLMSALVFLPLLTPLCKLSELIIKEKKEIGEKIEFKELDAKVMKTFPATGISLAYDLSNKMFKYTHTMFEKLKEYMHDPTDDLKEYIEELEKAIDNIDRHLADFLMHAETGTLTYSDLIKYNRIMRGIKDIERIGDYGENLLTFYYSMYDKKESFDDEQNKELTDAHEQALEIIIKTLETYRDANKEKALEIIKERRDYIKGLETYQNAYFKREMKKTDKDKKIGYLSLVYVDILNSYERVYAHCANIAKLFNTDKPISSYSNSDAKQFAEMSNRY